MLWIPLGDINVSHSFLMLNYISNLITRHLWEWIPITKSNKWNDALATIYVILLLFIHKICQRLPPECVTVYYFHTELGMQLSSSDVLIGNISGRIWLKSLCMSPDDWKELSTCRGIQPAKLTGRKVPHPRHGKSALNTQRIIQGGLLETSCNFVRQASCTVWEGI